MTDLRTYQTLAYLTHQPEKAREILGVPDYRGAGMVPGGWLLRPTLYLLGRALTGLGSWLLNQIGEAEGVAAARESRQRPAWANRHE